MTSQKKKEKRLNTQKTETARIGGLTDAARLLPNGELQRRGFAEQRGRQGAGQAAADQQQFRRHFVGSDVGASK